MSREAGPVRVFRKGMPWDRERMGLAEEGDAVGQGRETEKNLIVQGFEKLNYSHMRLWPAKLNSKLNQYNTRSVLLDL